jgi:ADP-ribosylglycohydrolase
MTVSTRDRFVGCLLGQCLGDALGFVVEGQAPAACRRYVDDYLRAGRAGELARDPFPFGQYSDDSQLARELLISFVACGRFDPADHAARLASLFASGRVVAHGRTSAAAAARLGAGIAWHEAGTAAPYATNGSAMRAGPVGLIAAPGDADELVRVAHDQARTTHADRRCSAGAVAIAGAVWSAVRGDDAQPVGWLDRLADWTGPFDHRFAAGVRALRGWLELPPAAAAAEIVQVDSMPGRSAEWPGISPFVTTSVLWSLYAFLRSPDDYWETICTAIAAGGDTDTTAAMAGAISGAHNGPDAVPRALAARLTDQGTWGYAALVDLAHSAHRVAMATAH